MRRSEAAKFQNVKWRFLSDAALAPTTAAQQPWSDDSRKRISHLEKALASTHDLEAQYQSFLQEVSKIEPVGTTFDGMGPGWAGIPTGEPLVGNLPASAHGFWSEWTADWRRRLDESLAATATDG